MRLLLVSGRLARPSPALVGLALPPRALFADPYVTAGQCRHVANSGSCTCGDRCRFKPCLQGKRGCASGRKGGIASIRIISEEQLGRAVVTIVVQYLVVMPSFSFPLQTFFSSRVRLLP